MIIVMDRDKFVKFYLRGSRCLCVMVCVFACMFVLVDACVFIPVIVCVFILVFLCLCFCACVFAPVIICVFLLVFACVSVCVWGEEDEIGLPQAPERVDSADELHGKCCSFAS